MILKDHNRQPLFVPIRHYSDTKYANLSEGCEEYMQCSLNCTVHTQHPAAARVSSPFLSRMICAIPSLPYVFARKRKSTTGSSMTRAGD